MLALASIAATFRDARLTLYSCPGVAFAGSGAFPETVSGLDSSYARAPDWDLIEGFDNGACCLSIVGVSTLGLSVFGCDTWALTISGGGTVGAYGLCSKFDGSSANRTDPFLTIGSCVRGFTGGSILCTCAPVGFLSNFSSWPARTVIECQYCRSSLLSSVQSDSGSWGFGEYGDCLDW